jgi:ribulose-phosphate 3-epimerase
MNVLPVINCPDIECIRKKLDIAKGFLFDGDMIHLDVTDGIFSKHKTWNDPLAWITLNSPFPFEAHLMVELPDEQIDDWLVAGAQRLIVHAEAMPVESFHEIVLAAERYRVEVMLSSKPDFPIEGLVPYFKYCKQFQVLAVNPGAAGQEFLTFVREKIGFLREEVPGAIIEVDGGMNEETVKLVKAYGADTVVSSSYIFNSQDPKQAYETLRNI